MPARSTLPQNRSKREWGPIDVWVNDAMATVFAEFVDITAEEFRRATEVTYLGTVYGTMAALHRMVPRDHGTVVQVGSALAYRAIPLQSAYCGAKFAIRGLHRQRAHRAAAQQEPGVDHDGAATRGEHPAVHWCRTKLPDHPMPVPPIYQPEVPAETVYWAAHHRRREVFCGASAAAVILANKFAPAIADRYLARTGFTSQQIAGMPVSPDRPNNLFEPVPRLAATHGMFDDKAKSHSLQAWLTTHRGIAVGAAVGTAAAATGAWRAARP